MAMLSQIFGGDEQTTLDVAQQPDAAQARSGDPSDSARDAETGAADSTGIDRLSEDEQFDTLNPQFLTPSGDQDAE